MECLRFRNEQEWHSLQNMDLECLCVALKSNSPITAFSRSFACCFAHSETNAIASSTDDDTHSKSNTGTANFDA